MGEQRAQALQRRQANRWRHAFRLWRSYLEGPELPPLDRWLAEAMKRSRYGARDRAWYGEVLFASVRFGLLASALEYAGGGSPGAGAAAGLFPEQVLEAARGALAQPRTILDSWRRAALPGWFDWVVRRYRLVASPDTIGPTPLELDEPEAASRRKAPWERLRAELAASEDLAARLVWHGIPRAYARHLEERCARSGWSGEELRRFLELQDRRPPIWLRLNDPERLEAALEELRARGFEVVAQQGEALAVEGLGSLYGLAAYEQGWIEVQDLASQCLGRLVEARPEEFVWDCCAGAGGKTVQIACASWALGRRGALYASDVDRAKLAEVRRRARRARAFNVRIRPWDGQTLPRFGPEVERRGGFDWVLVDAPCSSSGTWRRRPDDRLRFGLERLGSVTARQRRLLALASRALRPEGRLVYATCSWLVEENEGVVEAFLDEHPEHELVKMELFGAPGEDADTTFGAVLRRSESGR